MGVVRQERGGEGVSRCEFCTPGGARQCIPYEVFWAPSGAQGRPKPEGRHGLTPAHQRRSEGQNTKAGTAELVPHPPPKLATHTTVPVVQGMRQHPHREGVLAPLRRW